MILMRCIVPTVIFVCASAGIAAETPAQKIERGRYLVENVSVCYECHTPRLPDRQFDRSKWLKGAVLEVQPLEPIKGWHKTSPDLTPGSRLWLKWGEGAILKYLQTGIAPNGKPADPPMPAYKFSPADAEAVLEYLKSLK
jgi:mono/diheme cytochrome c family protein